MSETTGPLAGIRVVEITKYVQGPVAGMMLANLGADVIKIELVGRQDSMRDATKLHGVVLDDRGREWIYAAVNRNKRALALDVTSDEGRAVFRKLIERADVLVTNLRDNGLKAIGADPDTVLAINPRLIFAQGGGLGPEGPLAAEPCQDTIGMAYSGFMDNTSQTDAPNYPPGSMSDVLTGTSIASGVLAALVERATTGKGGIVRASQLQTMLWTQMLPIGMVATLGERMPRFTPQDATPLYSVYQTTDGWMAVAAIHPEHWTPLAHTVGIGHLLEDPRFSFENTEVYKKEVYDALAGALRQKTTAEWCEALRAAGVWCSPVNRIEQIPNDPQVLANGYLHTFPDGTVAPPTPFEVNGWQGVPGVAAAYSEHTDEILAELGLDDEARTALRASGTIW